MHVTVISRRTFGIEQRDHFIKLLEELEAQATKQRGFISRRTFSSLHDPGDHIVISDWQSADHWIEWMNRREVRKIHRDIDSLLGGKTLFDIYRPEARQASS